MVIIHDANYFLENGKYFNIRQQCYLFSQPYYFILIKMFLFCCLGDLIHYSFLLLEFSNISFWFSKIFAIYTLQNWQIFFLNHCSLTVSSPAYVITSFKAVLVCIRNTVDLLVVFCVPPSSSISLFLGYGYFSLWFCYFSLLFWQVLSKYIF